MRDALDVRIIFYHPLQIRLTVINAQAGLCMTVRIISEVKDSIVDLHECIRTIIVVHLY